MAYMNADFSVERVGPSEPNGWAVVYRKAGIPHMVIAVYLTRAQADAAAAQLQEESAKNA